MGASSSLGGDVEEVVGLVKQQDAASPAEQGRQNQALALSSGERVGGSVADLRQPPADDLAAGGVPLALELVTPQRRPAADRLSRASRRRVVAAASARSAASIRMPASLTPAGAGDEQKPRRTLPSPSPTSWGM